MAVVERSKIIIIHQTCESCLSSTASELEEVHGKSRGGGGGESSKPGPDGEESADREQPLLGPIAGKALSYSPCRGHYAKTEADVYQSV